MSARGLLGVAPAMSLTLVVLLAGCGGGNEEKSFGTRLDDLCFDTAEQIESLTPAKAEEDLTPQEISDRSQEISREFRDEVAGLEPPGELVLKRDQLVDALALPVPAPVPPYTAAIAYFERFEKDYLRLGAPGCAKVSKRTAEQLKAAAKAPTTK